MENELVQLAVHTTRRCLRVRVPLRG
jgi:hypothetical protein